MNKIQDQHKIILLTVISILAVWFADAAYNAFISEEGPFLELLLNMKQQEPYLRFFLSATILVFGTLIIRILHKRNQAEENLKKNSIAIESSMDGIAIFNSNSEYVYVNQAYASINGYESPQELMGKTFHIVYDQKERELMEQMAIPVLLKTGKWRGELIAKRKNGSTYFQEVSVSTLEDGGRVCVIRDITWRKRSEERLQRSERFLNTIFNSIRDPFCIFDDQFRIIRVNEAYSGLKSRSTDQLIGEKCYAVLEGRDAVCEGCVVEKTFNSADPCAKDKLVTHQDGTEIWVEIYTYPILDEEGKVSHVIEYTRDVTERKKAEDEKRRLIDRLEHLSRTDVLTGLMNRRALTDNLVYEIDRAKRYKSELSLILCDIDNFKEINDTFGHDIGDRALQLLSATLKTIVRKTDIAGRYGGDEFMLILPETGITGAESLAEKVLIETRNIHLEFHEGRSVRLSISIGISCLAPGGEEINTLIKRADDAMYNSKQKGRDRISIISC